MLGIKEEHYYLKDKMEIMMEQLSHLSRVQSQNTVSCHVYYLKSGLVYQKLILMLTLAQI